MNTRASTSPKADIVAEASAWFIEFRAADATVSDRARFFDWLHRSPEHIQAYLEIAEGWAQLPTSDPQGRLDIQALIRRARESPDDNVVSLVSQPALRTGRPRHRLHAWAASVAGFALLIGAALWVLQYGTHTYRTGVGEQRVVRLTDGSTLELNALSTVRVRLSEKAREIDLEEGQALFHVAKDRLRPFLVRSGATTVRAVGTQFDVYKKHTGTVITVLEGRVAVVAGESPPMTPRGDRPQGNEEPTSAPTPAPMTLKEIFLGAGEQLTVPTRKSQMDAKITPRRADVAAATAWVQKQLIFEETPLAEVAVEFNRYSARRLVITDPALRSMGVSGVYSSTQPESLLGFLRAQPNLQLSESEKEIRVALRKIN